MVKIKHAYCSVSKSISLLFTWSSIPYDRKMKININTTTINNKDVNTMPVALKCGLISLVLKLQSAQRSFRSRLRCDDDISSLPFFLVRQGADVIFRSEALKSPKRQNSLRFIVKNMKC